MARSSGWRISFLGASIAVAVVATGSPVQAQDAPADLGKVMVTGHADPVVDIAGFAGVPLSKAPYQATTAGAGQLRNVGATRLADLVRIDPAVSDAYNAEGYWDSLTVRGFVIDNRYNYRRDGLPISAETSIPLDNKERIDLLKGTTGLQAGTSAPGGLVDVVVKRPVDAPLRNVFVQWRQPGSVLAAVDIGQRFGVDAAFGVRLNAAAEHLDPMTHAARGDRNLLAVAGDWRLASDKLLEAEVELSHRSQPSVPGFSLLGGKVPLPRSIDPRVNLNDQPWSQPVVFDATNASLRYTQAFAPGWRWIAHLATQQLVTDDRLAYPSGCGKEGAYDRYCSDGTYDLYDYRSDGEHRRNDAAQLQVQGTWQTGFVAHTLAFGVLRNRVRNRYQAYASNQVFSANGIDGGNIAGTLFTPPDPTPFDPNTDIDERNTELFARDALRLGERATVWLGVRHSQLHRDAIQTDGAAPTAYAQSFTTPWLAASYAISAPVLAYASWGKGVESEVAPNRPRYTNPGQPLPALESRQWEIGLKAHSDAVVAGLTYFDITRPVFADVGTDCLDDAPGRTCTHQRDGTQRHRGVEADADLQAGPWNWRGGLQWLHARRKGSASADINDQRPTNVPATTFKLQGRYDVARLPGLTLQANLLAESNRMVLEDNSVAIGGYARVDGSLHYASAWGSVRQVWIVGVDNALNRRAWRESPLQYGHAYLFPLQPRTFRITLDSSL